MRLFKRRRRRSLKSKLFRRKRRKRLFGGRSGRKSRFLKGFKKGRGHTFGVG